MAAMMGRIGVAVLLYVRCTGLPFHHPLHDDADDRRRDCHAVCTEGDGKVRQEEASALCTDYPGSRPADDGLWSL